VRITTNQSDTKSDPNLPVADPETVKGEETMCQRRRHLLQMHTTNYMPFIREKTAYCKHF